MSKTERGITAKSKTEKSKASACLFSALGDADCRALDSGDDKQGAVLHILRNYPDIGKVILYLSREMIEKNEKVSFSEYVKLVRPDIALEFVERPDLVEVQHFDVFYDDMAAILDDMQKKNPHTKIYVNLSSGTPAMKSTLMILSELSELKLKPLQVDNPKYTSDKQRVYEVQTKNFRRMIVLDNIKALIDGYDYAAALRLAGGLSVKGLLDSGKTKLLEGMVARLEMRTADARNLLGKELHVQYLANRNDDIGRVFEHLQYLRTTCERKAWADFCRAITPGVTYVLLGLVDAFTRYEQSKLNKGSELNKDYILANPSLGKVFEANRRHRDAPWYIKNTQLIRLLEQERLSSELMELMRSTQDIDGLARNLFSHEIYAVAPDFENCYKPKKILGNLQTLLFRIAEKRGVKLPPWNSYEQLNDKIKERLQ